MAETLYDIFGLRIGASDHEIRAAYRRLARESHPDLGTGDPERFAQIEAAYRVLGDPESRARYDLGELDEPPKNPRAPGRFYRTHAEGPAGGKYAVMPDGHAFSGPSEPSETPVETLAPSVPEDLQFGIRVSFVDAAFGAVRPITLPNGTALDLPLPAGIEEGQLIRLKGKGETRGSVTGDLVFKVVIDPHPIFSRQGKDVHVDMPLTIAEASLGVKLSIPTIHGPVSARVPAGIDTGSVLRLPGKGIDTGDGAPGDQVVTAKIIGPGKLTQPLGQALHAWQRETGENPRGSWEALLS